MGFESFTHWGKKLMGKAHLEGAFANEVKEFAAVTHYTLTNVNDRKAELIWFLTEKSEDLRQRGLLSNEKIEEMEQALVRCAKIQDEKTFVRDVIAILEPVILLKHSHK